MKMVEAPEIWDGKGRGVFLAGGISGCADWQRDLAGMLEGTELVVVNPRRRGFPMEDAGAAAEQIGWEFEHLKKVWGVAFWFPPEKLCPIALFELGGQAARGKRLFVGTDAGYCRRLDVAIQMRLARPEVRVVGSLEALAGQICAAVRQECAA
jgi:hypothetical protein